MLRRIDYSWIILATGFVVLFFSSGSRFAFGLMFKPMSDDLGLSRSTLSLAFTTFTVVSALAMPVFGRMLDRYSTRWIMATSAGVGAIGIALMGRVSSTWQVFALYGVVYAIGHAGSSVAPVGVMVSRWFGRRRRGIASSAAISGNAVGQLVIITALASSLTALGWRSAYALLGIINLAVVVPLVLATVRTAPLREPDGDGEREAVRGPGAPPSVVGNGLEPADTPVRPDSVLGSRQFWLLAIVFGICGFQDFFVATHVVAFADDQGVSSVLAGNMLALMGLMGLLGIMASGVLADAFGAARPTALCFLMRIFIFGFIIYFQDTTSIVVFALLYGFTFLITAPLTVVFAANIFGTGRLGTVTGLINMVHQVAGGLGAFVGALMFDHWGTYDAAFVLMLGLAVVAGATALLVHDRPPAPAPVATTA